MKKIIKLEHISKIEGHAKLTIKIEQGKVKKTRLDIFEGARFFEMCSNLIIFFIVLFLNFFYFLFLSFNWHNSQYSLNIFEVPAKALKRLSISNLDIPCFLNNSASAETFASSQGPLQQTHSTDTEGHNALHPPKVTGPRHSFPCCSKHMFSFSLHSTQTLAVILIGFFFVKRDFITRINSSLSTGHP